MSSRKTETAFAGLEAELMAEAAQSLGVAGKRLERALAALAACGADRAALRRELLESASSAAYAYVVQREALGFRDTAAALDVYAVPTEVRVRMGKHVPAPAETAPEDPLAYFARRGIDINKGRR